MRIQCQTLFDITNTGVTGHFRSSKLPFVDHSGRRIADNTDWNTARNQQRNWETIMQLISLRCQIANFTDPVMTKNKWAFEFEVEIESIFSIDGDPLAVLKQDCNGVPMLINVDSENLSTDVLQVDNNIWFDIVE